ncbi:MAG TPA: carotenoid biosynthesis protein [Mycobacteriales bacterium]|nr:carotenoid biosynthesis protein [Mycobacteriales bacterium]
MLAASTVLAQVAYPLVRGEVRDTLTVLTVLLFAAASLTHAALTRGTRAALALLVVCAGGGLLAEAVGVSTGVPFGRYSYAGTLGATLLGVPVVVPLAWLMMAWPAYLVGARLTQGRGRMARVPVAAAALAAWDLFLDPQMVDAGQWRWADPAPALPGVPTVPLSNYAGWVLVAVVLMGLLDAVVRTGPSTKDTVPYVLYLWTWASSVLAHAGLLGLAGSAVWGGLGMGALAVPLALSLRARAVARAPARRVVRPVP